MVIKCSYKECPSRYGQASGISFFRFPVQNRDKYLEWILRSKNEDFLDLPNESVASKRICSLHFPRSAFMNAECKKLTRNAIPDMYESVDKPEELAISEISDIPVQNAHDESLVISAVPTETAQSDPVYDRSLCIPPPSDELVCLKKRLSIMTEKYRNERRKATRRAPHKLMRKISDRGQLSRDIGKYVTGLPYIFIQMQLRKGKFSIWEKKEKELALAFYYRSPKLYKALLTMGFKLPSIRSIQKWNG